MNVLHSPAKQYSFHYEDPLCLHKVQNAVQTMLMALNGDKSKTVVYLCIGTDRATGDCLGPLVGTRLQCLLSDAEVYGTLQEPAHAANLQGIWANLQNICPAPLVVAIDASLGNAERVGFINIKKGFLQPGTALKKDLPKIGDFYISGVVNVGGYLEYMVLQNTRLSIVYRMADIIARSIFLAHRQFERNTVAAPLEAPFS